MATPTASERRRTSASVSSDAGRGAWPIRTTWPRGSGRPRPAGCWTAYLTSARCGPDAPNPRPSSGPSPALVCGSGTPPWPGTSCPRRAWRQGSPRPSTRPRSPRRTIACSSRGGSWDSARRISPRSARPWRAVGSGKRNRGPGTARSSCGTRRVPRRRRGRAARSASAGAASSPCRPLARRLVAWPPGGPALGGRHLVARRLMARRLWPGT